MLQTRLASAASRNCRAELGRVFALALVVTTVAGWITGSTTPAFASPAGVEAAKKATVALSMPGFGTVGSGVVVAPGWVLTAAHVVKDSRDMGTSPVVVDQSGIEQASSIEAYDPSVDLALLQVKGSVGQPIKSAADGKLASGDEVYALGYPLGLKHVSVTKGVVSAPVQEIEGQSYIQTDASINPGNSGGPLVTPDGALLGVNVAKAAHEGIDNIGFAVPLATVKSFLQPTPAALGASGSPAVSGKPTTSGQAAAAPGAAAVPDVGGQASAPTGGGGAASNGGSEIMLLVVLLGAGLVWWAVASSRAGAARRELTVATGGPAASLATGLAAPRTAVPSPGPHYAFRLAGPTGTVDRDVTVPALVGRGASADIDVDDPEVSRMHARIVDDGRTLRIEDLASRNGLVSGGSRVAQVDLSVGDTVVLGQTRLTRLA